MPTPYETGFAIGQQMFGLDRRRREEALRKVREMAARRALAQQPPPQTRGVIEAPGSGGLMLNAPSANVNWGPGDALEYEALLGDLGVDSERMARAAAARQAMELQQKAYEALPDPYSRANLAGGRPVAAPYDAGDYGVRNQYTGDVQWSPAHQAKAAQYRRGAALMDGQRVMVEYGPDGQATLLRGPDGQPVSPDDAGPDAVEHKQDFSPEAWFWRRYENYAPKPRSMEFGIVKHQDYMEQQKLALERASKEFRWRFPGQPLPYVSGDAPASVDEPEVPDLRLDRRDRAGPGGPSVIDNAGLPPHLQQRQPQASGQYQLGQILINGAGERARVVGFDANGQPLLELVR